MPTVILLDSSLSMARPISSGDKSESVTTITRKQLAITGIGMFLDHLSSNCKLEFVSLITFSHTFCQLVPFTRDYNEIKSALATYDDHSISNIEAGLEGAARVVLNEWGSCVSSQVLLVTEGRLGVGEYSLPSYLKKLTAIKNSTNKKLFPFSFPSSLHVLCLTLPTLQENFAKAMSLYKQLLALNNGSGEGKVYTPDKSLNVSSVKHMFAELSEKSFVHHFCLLKCGNLSCHISVFPDFHKIKSNMVWPELEICGFLNTSDVSSPPSISKHLILPVTDPSTCDDKESLDKLSAFTVLLHGSLKVENMVAVVQISNTWFGMLYSHADSKKKSNLLLACFAPGFDAIPWLGNFNRLGPIKENEVSPYMENKSPFPVATCDRKSYSQNCVVWIHNSGLQGDIQKILRNARKLPEKQTQFYKEMNRLKKAVLAIGFFELFESLASLLDREKSLLASHSHPAIAIQISHASKILRSPQIFDINQVISPPQINLV